MFRITRNDGTDTAQLVMPDGTQWTLTRSDLFDLFNGAEGAIDNIDDNPAGGAIRQAAAEYRRDPGLDLRRRTV